MTIPPHPPLNPTSDLIVRFRGVLCGIAAAFIWASCQAYARAGVNSGLAPEDFVLLRFGTAALLMLPWLLTNSPKTLGGVGWGRAVILSLLAGPLFFIFTVGGFVYAPLSHGAVIQPSTITLASLFAAALWLGEQLTFEKLLGTAVVIGGLLLIASQSAGVAGGQAWVGHLLFTLAGLLWAAFTVLVRHWKLGGFQATAAVSLVSGLVVVPAFPILSDFSRFAAADPGAIVTQVVVQGLMAGVLAVVAIGISIQVLGAARASLFSALVPATALVIGIPITGETPTFIESLGGLVTTIGLVVALGAIGRRKPVSCAMQ